MSKEKDLKLVFDFIANYLRENEEKKEKEVIQDNTVSKITGLPRIPKFPIMTQPHIINDDIDDSTVSNLKTNVNRGLEIMKRLDDIDKAKANAVNMLKVDESIRHSLNKQLQDLRTEHAMMLSEDTIAEEKANTSPCEFIGNITLENYTGATKEESVNSPSVQDISIMENLEPSIVTTASAVLTQETKKNISKSSSSKKFVNGKKPTVKRKTKK